MPGYVHGTGKFLLRECVNTTLSYNPAFVAQGDIMQGYRTGGWFSLVLVGRANDEAGALLTRVYERIAPADRCPAICLMSPESAEIAKVTINSPPPPLFPTLVTPLRVSAYPPAPPRPPRWALRPARHAAFVELLPHYQDLLLQHGAPPPTPPSPSKRGGSAPSLRAANSPLGPPETGGGPCPPPDPLPASLCDRRPPLPPPPPLSYCFPYRVFYGSMTPPPPPSQVADLADRTPGADAREICEALAQAPPPPPPSCDLLRRAGSGRDGARVAQRPPSPPPPSY